MQTLLRVLAWVISVLFIVAGVAGLFTGSPAFGIVLLLIAACAFPPLWSKLRERGFSPPQWTRWLAAIVLLVIGGAVAPDSTPTSPATPTKSDVQPAGTQAPSTREDVGGSPPAVEKTAPPAPSNWSVSTDVSPLDDSRNVYASVDAEEKVKGWLMSERPQLVARCKEGKTEIYVEAKTQLHTFDFDYGRKITNIKYRIGGGAPKAARASESTDGNAFFVPNPIAVLKSLKGQDRFVVEYTPFQAGLGTAVFDTTGSAQAVDAISAACKWQ